jgi:hypothetical protein
VIVHDFDILSAIVPPEANTPLIVDPYAVLPSAVAMQRLKAIAWRHAQIGQSRHRIEKQQLPSRYALNGAEPPYVLVMKQPLGFAVRKASDHA